MRLTRPRFGQPQKAEPPKVSMSTSGESPLAPRSLLKTPSISLKTQQSKLPPKPQRPLKSSYCWSPQRYLCFDLENRPLAYWYDGETTSEITAFGWKWSDEDHVYTMLLQADGKFFCQGLAESVVPGATFTLSDRDAYTWFVEELEEADVVYGHNIRRHDLPMLQAGLLRRQMKPLPSLTTSDTLKDYPRRKGLSASLENLAAMYGLEGEKKTMRQPDWEKANRLTPDGMELARERVASDVLLQEALRNKLKELELLGPARKWNP